MCPKIASEMISGENVPGRHAKPGSYVFCVGRLLCGVVTGA